MSTDEQTTTVIITEPFWHAIKDRVMNTKIEFHIECAMCLEEVTIDPRDHVESNFVLQRGGKRLTHKAIILPCGHIFGDLCWILHHNARHPEEAKCPCCRASFLKPCGHTLPRIGFPVQLQAREDFINFGHVLKECRICDKMKLERRASV